MSGSECNSKRQFHQNEADADIEDFFFIESPVDPLSMDYDNTEEVEEVEEDGINEEVKCKSIHETISNIRSLYSTTYCSTPLLSSPLHPSPVLSSSLLSPPLLSAGRPATRPPSPQPGSAIDPRQQNR